MATSNHSIINTTFNLLTVVALAHRRPTGEQLFYCDCLCGTKNHIATKHQLISGNLKSCGCLRKSSDTLAGQVFNRLIVLGKGGKYINPAGAAAQLFSCLCKCGNIIETTKSKLKLKEVQSCGCLLKELNDRYKDLVGNRYGKLLVIRRLGTITKRRDIFWECVCDCGNTINVTTGNLVHGHNIGCGCVNMDNIRAYRISKGKDPSVSIKSTREALRGHIKKLGLDKKVFIRDNYTCQLCNAKGILLNAHHIIPIAVNESLACNSQNMITLCKACHFEKAHNKDYKKIDIAIQAELIQKNSLLGKAVSVNPTV